MALASVDVDRLSQDTLRTMNAGWAPPCNAYEDDMGLIFRWRSRRSAGHADPL